MLLQLHHQFPDGHTEFCSQTDIETHQEIRKWEQETAEQFPLPEGAQWLVCNEKSRHFVKAPACEQ